MPGCGCPECRGTRPGEIRPKFNVGDEVRITANTSNHGYTIGEITTIKWIQRGYNGRSEYFCGSWYIFDGDGELAESKSNQMTEMSIREKFLLAFKGEPEKSFRKAGITNGDDLLTDEGQKIFLSWLLKAKLDASKTIGEQFKSEVVDSILADDEKKKA